MRCAGSHGGGDGIPQKLGFSEPLDVVMLKTRFKAKTESAVFQVRRDKGRENHLSDAGKDSGGKGSQFHHDLVKRRN